METLRTAIEQQVQAREYDDTLNEYLVAEAKIGVLERKKPPTQLQTNDAFQAFLARHDALEDALESREDFEAVATGFRNIDRA
jgi:hypothetical protein